CRGVEPARRESRAAQARRRPDRRDDRRPRARSAPITGTLASEVSSDLRPCVAEEIRLHPRVAYQGLLSEEGAATRVAAALPALQRFRHEYARAISLRE